jgi:hypothetical protein
LDVQKVLEENIGVQNGEPNRGKNISSVTICGNQQCALTDGKAVNADFVIFGTIVKSKQSAMKTLGESGEDQYLAKKVTGTVYVIELKLLDRSTGKVISSLKRNAANSELLKNTANEFVKKTEVFYKARE